jgi:rubrerythrin
MVAYSILLNLLLLIGVGCIVGILVVAIMVNMKLSTLIRNMSELNKNLNNMKDNTVPYKHELDAHAASFKEEQMIQERINSLQRNESLKDVKKQNTEEIKQNTDEIQQSVNQQNMNQQNFNQQNSNKKDEPTVVGIVFCRNCASHFTSDKDACPICGARRS